MNDLITANEFTGNRLKDSEDLLEESLQAIKKKLSRGTKEEDSIYKSHSINKTELHIKRKK